MKVAGYALIAAALLCGAAYAEAPSSEHFWVAPKFDAKLAQWPKDSAGRPLYGKATLDCAVGPDGFATDCLVKSEEPVSPALREAAPKIAALYKARNATSGRAPLEMEVNYDVGPDWLKKPSLDELMAVYPSASHGASGRATLHCWVQTSGLLRSCEVWEESPKGKGFGGAAVALSKTFLMKAATREGQPVESEVTMPINFSGGPDWYDSAVTVLGTPIWARTPTVGEILAEIDKKVGDKFADGKVVLQCEVAKKTGLLSECVLANASPGMDEFRGVAHSLTSKFQIALESLADKKNSVRVNLAFSFPDMTSVVWSGRYLSRVHWTRVPSADPNRKTFPDDAAKAGLKEGMATVDCVVGSDGGLTHCKTVSESTPGVGFGPVAEQIAQVFATNPWTDDGLPAEGAHVQLPIKMVDADADKPAPGAAPAAMAKP